MLVKMRPITPGQRQHVKVVNKDLYKGRPVPALTVGLRKTGGRNNKGQICVRHRGGGHKRLYRLVDFKRSIMDQPGVVQRLEYDPNRSADIALLKFPNGDVRYIIAPQNVVPGDSLLSSRLQELDAKAGNAMLLGRMPVGTTIHAIEVRPGMGAQLCRSAGASATIMDKHGRPGYVMIKLQSKEVRYVLANCMATVGIVSNPLHNQRVLGKAGRSRWLGRRPKVRGVAMNPVDHPMGGGNGKTSGGRTSCTPWGVPCKGYKTGRKHAKANAMHGLILSPRGRSKKWQNRLGMSEAG